MISLAVAGMNDVLNSQGYTQAAWNRIPKAAWSLMIAIASLLFLLFLRHRFRNPFGHGVFSFTKKFSKLDQRASGTTAIKPEVREVKQLDDSVDDIFVSSVRENVCFALIDFRG